MRRNKKRNWWLYIFGIAAILSFLYIKFSGTNHNNQPQPPIIEKSGAGAKADFTKASETLHRHVDTILAKQKGGVKYTTGMQRETPRIQAEGEIKWHVRHLLVEMPADVKLEDFISTVEKGLKQHNARIFAQQPDYFQGYKTHRLDIGFQTDLDQEPISIITDKIYIITGSPKQAEPPVRHTAEMAIIIDDFGYSAEAIPAFSQISQPLTFSVLPYRPYSNEAASNALSKGHQVMLHLPMEPLVTTHDTEPVVISASMTDKQINDALVNALAAIPGAVGINNHQGSKATADQRVVRTVMTVIKPRSLFFVDSRTNAKSVAAATAKQFGIRTAENNLFIDNDPDINAIKARLRQAIEMARRQKKIIIIGHARLSTAAALRDMLPEIQRQGIKLVFASQLVK